MEPYEFIFQLECWTIVKPGCRSGLGMKRMLARIDVSLRVIQRISGHKNLNVLQGYVDVSEEEVVSACATRW